MTGVRIKLDVKDVASSLNTVLSRNRIRKAASAISDYVARQVSAYIGRRAPSRHKSANRLGATPTGILEFTSGNPAYSRGGGLIYGESRGASSYVNIENVAGITRAFHDLVITPKKARALTIPINAMSYAKSAADMERMGWSLFVPRSSRRGKRSGVLMGKKGNRTVALFAFAQSVRVKRDARLLPYGYMISRWAKKAAIQSLTGGVL